MLNQDNKNQVNNEKSELPLTREQITEISKALKEELEKPKSAETTNDLKKSLEAFNDFYREKQAQQRTSDTATLIRAIDSKYQGDDNKVIEAFRQDNKKLLGKDENALIEAAVNAYKDKFNPKVDKPSLEMIRAGNLKSSFSCAEGCTEEQIVAYSNLRSHLSESYKRKNREQSEAPLKVESPDGGV